MNTAKYLLDFIYHFMLDEIQTVSEIEIFCRELEVLIARMRKQARSTGYDMDAKGRLKL